MQLKFAKCGRVLPASQSIESEFSDIWIGYTMSAILSIHMRLEANPRSINDLDPHVNELCLPFMAREQAISSRLSTPCLVVSAKP